MIVQTSVCKEAVNKGFAAEHLNFNVKTTCINACFYQSKVKTTSICFQQGESIKIEEPYLSPLTHLATIQPSLPAHLPPSHF